MELAQMVAETRNRSGKGISRKIRQGGRIPAIFYGPDVSPIPLSIDPRDLQRIISSPRGVNTIIELKLINSEDKGESQKMAMLKDWQVHPVRRTLLHADLYEINVNRPIGVNVPLRFVGKAKAVAAGGLLEEVRREISVECLPAMIPDFIEVEVSQLDFGDSIHVRELKVPEGIKIKDDPEMTIVIIMTPSEEKEKVVAAAEELPAVEAPAEQPEEETEKE